VVRPYLYDTAPHKNRAQLSFGFSEIARPSLISIKLRGAAGGLELCCRGSRIKPLW
jgi:hypothetical protein